MTLDQTIIRCAQLGVRLTLTEDGRLRVNAPQGALDNVLRDALTHHKTAITETLSRQRGPTEALVAPRASHYPLSHAQRRLWILDQIEPGSSAYLIPSAMTLEDSIDVDTLFDAIRAVARRHESLRTTFKSMEGAPYQVIHDEPLVDLSVVDLTAQADAQRSNELALTQALRAEMRTGFDLEQGPLFRARVFLYGSGRRVLFLAMHHIIGDGWSNSIFLSELQQHYAAIKQGRAQADLPPLSRQYVDYAHWQNQTLDESTLQRLLGYWRNQLQDAPMLQLPTDRARLPADTSPGDVLRQQFSRKQHASLLALANTSGATLFTVLLSAFYVLLYRLSGQHDLVIGTDVANRTRREWEPLIGFFVNQLVLRADVSGSPTFNALIKRVHGLTLDAYANQDMPFNVLVEHLVQARDAQASPFFQTKFIMQNTPGAAATEDASTAIELPERIAKFDMTWSVSEDGNGLLLELEYACNLFNQTTIQRWMDHYSDLLTQICEAPDRTIDQFDLAPAHRLQQIASARRCEALPARADTLGSYVEQWASTMPEAIAVRSGSATITYRDLNQQANRLARHLRDWGVELETPVGVCMGASIDFVVAVTAVSKAGGVLVAMDPSYPEQRLAHILEASDLQVLLCQSQYLDRLPAYHLNFLGVIKTDIDAAAWSDLSPDNLGLPRHPDQLAYLVFTSGTTGKPKGVMVSASGIGNLADAQAETFKVTPDSRILQFASVSFDASFWELLMALAHGACLVAEPKPTVMPGSDLAQALTTYQITHVTLPPTALSVMAVDSARTLDALILAGEACRDEVVQPWAAVTRPFNAYGPSETTVCASVDQYDDACCGFGGSIGRAIAGCGLYVIDRTGNLALPMAAGELWITGAAVGRGYWHDPAQTALRFVPDPFSNSPGARVYRSGDLARMRVDNRVEFLGRLDQQVKIRGHRIEIGEIERNLLAQPSLTAAVVIASGEPLALHAYVVATNGQSINELALKKVLRQSLPEYMIPRTITGIQAIPTTANGKIDVGALPAPQRAPQTIESLLAKSPQQIKVAEIWCEILGLDTVGLDDNFFDVGGHSLLLIQVQDRIRQRLGLSLSVADLFKYPTVRDLALQLGSEEQAATEVDSNDRIARRQQASRERAQRRQPRPAGVNP